MGVYNGFVSDESFFCSVCGEECDDVQEYDLGYAKWYKIGDRVDCVDKKYNGNTIAERCFYCMGKNCIEKKERIFGYAFTEKCYIIIKNYKFIGITLSLFLAECLLDEENYYLDKE